MRTRPQMGQLGRTGTMRLMPFLAQREGGRIIAYRTDTITIDELDRVRQDPVIRSSLFLMKLPILRSDWNVLCDDEEIATFCQRVLQPHIRSILWNLLTALDFGFSIQEIVWTSDDVTATVGLANAPDMRNLVFRDAWVIQRLAPLDPQFVYPLVDAFGNFAGAKQLLDGTVIEAEKLIHWAANAEFNEVYGNPAIKAAIPFWELKQRALEDAALFHNIYAVPTKKGFAPPGQIEVGIDGDGNPIMEDNMQYLQALLEELQSAHNIVLPSTSLDGGRVWDVEAFDVPPPIDYTEWISFLDQQMRLSMGVPQLAVTTSETGTYNLGVAQVDLFIDNEMAYVAQIEEVLTNQLLSKLVAYNFGSMAPPAKLVMRLDNLFVKQLVQGMLQQMAQGLPVRTASGALLVPDWAKIAEDVGVPVMVMEELPYEEETQNVEVAAEHTEESTNFAGEIQ
ncbi:MAG: hypothetical protein KatS3mg023_3927 [Armatimonadota bacterium]|nr:MAG: hypothetical protein KatS3mg023_3927 [Armatimonadota bacterium]